MAPSFDLVIDLVMSHRKSRAAAPRARSAVYRLHPVQHHFAGHAYTIGIEEELMFLDPDSLELVNAIEAMLEPAPVGEIKPELMESVLEISTDPCADITEASRQLIALGLSANSPFWRADLTGMASTRTPIFRAFPRVGIPPTYQDWADYERQIDFMIEARVIEDYTYLWHDVRPHPAFGTVEVRVMDSQTHVEHTLGLAALVQGLVKELSEHFEAGKRLSRYPFEMLDENKWLAARHGLEGELVDLPSSDRVGTRELARRLLDRMRPHCEELGSAAELEGVEDLLERGNGAARQVVVYEANHDLREVMGEIVAASGGYV